MNFKGNVHISIQRGFGKDAKKRAGKLRGIIIFPPFWCLVQKLDHNTGLDANQREISSNINRRLLWPFEVGKFGKRVGEMV